jgi:hypothetical protein
LCETAADKLPLGEKEITGVPVPSLRAKRGNPCYPLRLRPWIATAYGLAMTEKQVFLKFPRPLSPLSASFPEFTSDISGESDHEKNCLFASQRDADIGRLFTAGAA